MQNVEVKKLINRRARAIKRSEGMSNNTDKIARPIIDPIYMQYIVIVQLLLLVQNVD